MSRTFSVLVTGATGQQGGATARQLRKHGHPVRALTRKTDSPAAQELTRLGAEVVAGSLEDRASLERVLTGVDALFLVTTPFESGTEMAQILAQASGRPIRYVPVPLAAVKAQSEDMGLMFEWFERVGYSADIPGLRRDYPEVGWRSFSEWSQSQAWGRLAGGA